MSFIVSSDECVFLLQSRNCELLGAYACPDLESHVRNLGVMEII